MKIEQLPVPQPGGPGKTLLANGGIEVLSIADNEPIDAWAKSKTNGLDVDAFIDAMGPGAQHETLQQGVRALKRGGRAVNIGAIAGMAGKEPA